MTREDELRSLHNGDTCPCYVCHIARLKVLAAKLEAENAELRAKLANIARPCADSSTVDPDDPTTWSAG